MQKTEATEDYVENLLVCEQIRITSISKDLILLKQNINLFLQANNENSIYNLCTFLNDADFIKTYNKDSEIAYCILAAYITAQEFNDTSNNILFLCNLHSIQDIVYEITMYKFNIINIEFNTNKEHSINDIYNKISTNLLSTIALKYFIDNFSINKTYVLECISDYFNHMDDGITYLNQLQ